MNSTIIFHKITEIQRERLNPLSFTCKYAIIMAVP